MRIEKKNLTRNLEGQENLEKKLVGGSKSSSIDCLQQKKITWKNGYRQLIVCHRYSWWWGSNWWTSIELFQQRFHPHPPLCCQHYQRHHLWPEIFDVQIRWLIIDNLCSVLRLFLSSQTCSEFAHLSNFVFK